MTSSIYILNWHDGTLHVNGVIMAVLGIAAVIALIIVLVSLALVMFDD